MKYIKLFENDKFKKGDYVKIIGDEKNLYKIYTVSEIGRSYDKYKEQYILIDKNDQFTGQFIKSEWTMWFDKEDLRPLTDLEIDTIKYNL